MSYLKLQRNCAVKINRLIPNMNIYGKGVLKGNRCVLLRCMLMRKKSKTEDIMSGKLDIGGNRIIGVYDPIFKI